MISKWVCEEGERLGAVEWHIYKNDAGDQLAVVRVADYAEQRVYTVDDDGTPYAKARRWIEETLSPGGRVQGYPVPL